MSVQLWRGKYCLVLFVVEVIERRRWRDKETREMIMEKRVCLWNALGGKHDARYPYLPTLVIIFQPYGNHKEFDQGPCPITIVLVTDLPSALVFTSITYLYYLMWLSLQTVSAFTNAENKKDGPGGMDQHLQEPHWRP